MSCDPQAITALFFDELPAHEAAAVQRHAHACGGCGQTLADLRADRERLRAPRGAMTSLDVLFRGVEARIADSRRARRVRTSWMPGLVPLGGACLALLLAVVGRVSGMPGVALASAEPVAGLMCLADPTPEADPWSDSVASAEARSAACLIASPAASASSGPACF